MTVRLLAKDETEKSGTAEAERGRFQLFQQLCCWRKACLPLAIRAQRRGRYLNSVNWYNWTLREPGPGSISGLCYERVQMGIVITQRSDVYVVALYSLWIAALEPCCWNNYWLGGTGRSWFWLFMLGLTCAGSIWPPRMRTRNILKNFDLQ